MNDSNGEDLRVAAKCSWRRLESDYAMAVAVCVAAYAAHGISPQLGLPSTGAGVLGIAVLCIRPLYRHSELWVEVTDRRLIVTWKIFKINTRTVNLNRIEAIDVRQSVPQRAPHFGSMAVRGMGSTAVVLTNVECPRLIRSIAREGTDAASKSL